MSAVLVHKADCIEHKQRGKYGRTHRYIGGVRRIIGMHTAALMDRTGEEPNGRQCLHHCDNHKCINGAHLYWGDHAQNMKDRADRNRAKPGLARKLTPAEVCRARLGSESIDVLAAQTKATRTAIYNARTGRTYRDVPCPC